MPVLAAIFDAFGTLVKISEGSHPYRKILKLGIEQGRRPQPTDAEALLSLPMDLRQTADFFGIRVDSGVMARWESDLCRELANIQAYRAGLSGDFPGRSGNGGLGLLMVLAFASRSRTIATAVV